MISIVRNKCDVVIKVKTDLPAYLENGKETSVSTLNFKFSCSAEWVAELLCRHIEKQMSETIQKIRHNEFADGWRHAKNRKRGKNFFQKNNFDCGLWEILATFDYLDKQ